jgi:hypothetical protein
MHPGLSALWRAATGAHPTDASAAMRSFRDRLMGWFDDAMTRNGERYTLWSQYRLFLIGMFLAVSLNADTLKIASALWTPASIEQTKTILEAAEKLVAAGGALDGPSVAKLTLNDTLDQIDRFTPPLGWGAGVTECEVAAHLTPSFLDVWPLTSVGRLICPPRTGAEAHKLEEVNAAKLLGWLITALAISFGAQFWFDALGSFVRLRSGGLPPRSSERPAASKS